MAQPEEHIVVPGVLAENERIAVQLRFGVAEAQVIRDHAISHILAAIADTGTDGVVFFGGTALARTHLTDLRLSEDIDLIAVGDRREAAEHIEGAIRRRLRRTLGSVSFTPRLRDTRHPAASVVEVAESRIQIQLLSHQGYPAWPTEVRDIEQRYRDAPAARLRVLTRPAFVASKLSSWHDRRAPRDLYDLWALAEAGAINDEAAELFARLGPLVNAKSISFADIPTDEEWGAALGHQGRIRATPREAAARVNESIAAL